LKLSQKTNWFDSGLDPVTSKKKESLKENSSKKSGNTARAPKVQTLNPDEQPLRQNKNAFFVLASFSAGAYQSLT
jgi:hypothetical protein